MYSFNKAMGNASWFDKAVKRKKYRAGLPTFISWFYYFCYMCMMLDKFQNFSKASVSLTVKW